MKRLTVKLAFLFQVFLAHGQDTIQLGTVAGPFQAVSGRVYVGGIITGFIDLEMVPIGNNLWESQPISQPAVVKVGGEYRLPGRTPNTGYWRVSTNHAANSFTSATTLPAVTGGEVVVRKNEWIIDRGIISTQSGNRVTYANISPDQHQVNWGFFLQNHRATLDLQGEWSYTDGRLLVYWPGGTDPVVRASQHDNLITGNGATFVGTVIEGAGVFAARGTNRYINCVFRDNGSFGVYASNAAGVVVEGSSFTNTGNVAVMLQSCPGPVVRNNTIRNTGIEGQGTGGGVTALEYSAVSLSGCSNARVEGNTIVRTGYNAVHFLFAGGARSGPHRNQQRCSQWDCRGRFKKHRRQPGLRHLHGRQRRQHRNFRQHSGQLCRLWHLHSQCQQPHAAA